MKVLKVPAHSTGGSGVGYARGYVHTNRAAPMLQTTIIALTIACLTMALGCNDDAPRRNRSDAGATDGGPLDADSDVGPDTLLIDDVPVGACVDGFRPSAGAPCPIEGEVCGYGCDPDPCGFCAGFQCSGGQWSWIEDAPPPECGNQCDPLAPSCSADDGCYLSRSGTFACLPAGTLVEEQACPEPNDCSRGSICIVCADSSVCGTVVEHCRKVCDPDAADADGFCGGRCERLSDHGYGYDDVGFCIFLGG